jgi:hypothetical protein
MRACLLAATGAFGTRRTKSLVVVTSAFHPKQTSQLQDRRVPNGGVTRFAEPALAGWWIVRSSDKKYLIVEVEPTDKPRTVHCASHNSP